MPLSFQHFENIKNNFKNKKNLEKLPDEIKLFRALLQTAITPDLSEVYGFGFSEIANIVDLLSTEDQRYVLEIMATMLSESQFNEVLKKLTEYEKLKTNMTTFMRTDSSLTRAFVVARKYEGRSLLEMIKKHVDNVFSPIDQNAANQKIVDRAYFIGFMNDVINEKPLPDFLLQHCLILRDVLRDPSIQPVFDHETISSLITGYLFLRFYPGLIQDYFTELQQNNSTLDFARTINVLSKPLNQLVQLWRSSKVEQNECHVVIDPENESIKEFLIKLTNQMRAIINTSSSFGHQGNKPLSGQDAELLEEKEVKQLIVSFLLQTAPEGEKEKFEYFDSQLKALKGNGSFIHRARRSIDKNTGLEDVCNLAQQYLKAKNVQDSAELKNILDPVREQLVKGGNLKSDKRELLNNSIQKLLECADFFNQAWEIVSGRKGIFKKVSSKNSLRSSEGSSSVTEKEGLITQAIHKDSKLAEMLINDKLSKAKKDTEVQTLQLWLRKISAQVTEQGQIKSNIAAIKSSTSTMVTSLNPTEIHLDSNNSYKKLQDALENAFEDINNITFEKIRDMKGLIADALQDAQNINEAEVMLNFFAKLCQKPLQEAVVYSDRIRNFLDMYCLLKPEGAYDYVTQVCSSLDRDIVFKKAILSEFRNCIELLPAESAAIRFVSIVQPWEINAPTAVAILPDESRKMDDSELTSVNNN